MSSGGNTFSDQWVLWSSMATVFTAVVGLTAFSVNLFDRVVQVQKDVDQLQQQVHSLAATPAPTSPLILKDGSLSQPVPNPTAAICAELAKRSADEISRGSWLTSEQIQKNMAALQCSGATKN